MERGEGVLSEAMLLPTAVVPTTLMRATVGVHGYKDYVFFKDGEKV